MHKRLPPSVVPSQLKLVLVRLRKSQLEGQVIEQLQQRLLLGVEQVTLAQTGLVQDLDVLEELGVLGGNRSYLGGNKAEEGT